MPPVPQALPLLPLMLPWLTAWVTTTSSSSEKWLFLSRRPAMPPTPMVPETAARFSHSRSCAPPVRNPAMPPTLRRPATVPSLRQ